MCICQMWTLHFFSASSKVHWLERNTGTKWTLGPHLGSQSLIVSSVSCSCSKTWLEYPPMPVADWLWWVAKDAEVRLQQSQCDTCAMQSGVSVRCNRCNVRNDSFTPECQGRLRERGMANGGKSGTRGTVRGEDGQEGFQARVLRHSCAWQNQHIFMWRWNKN